MKLIKSREILRDFNRAIEDEWIETNGLGGWSGSSVIGCNTRRYHGLLVAATNPPAERTALVSKLDETIVSDGIRTEWGTNLYAADTIHPKGHLYIEQFERKLFPEWIFETGDIRVKKTIAMIHGENTVLVLYDVLEAPGVFEMELQPFFSVRGYHSLMHANDAVNLQSSFSNGVFSSRLYNGTPEIFISVPGSNFIPSPAWYYRFQYPIEKYRGLDFEEDLFTSGMFKVNLSKGQSIGIIVSTENPAGRDAYELLAAENLRRLQLLDSQPGDEIFRQLVLAADQFIVRRSTDLKTIIAGYHWFTDWGRDTMISLPGLCLSTGRFEDARKILLAFAQSVSMGMLPNRFQDNNEPPEYNNVDGTLWYFIAVYKYLQATGDQSFVLEQILPVLKDIIDWHFKGTRYNIKATEDGLLQAGEEGQQLTWMDARVGNWVVTPRMGKPVEIQALWYNALCIFADLLQMNGQSSDAGQVLISAEKARQSFLDLFWFNDGGYCFDVIDMDGVTDATLRPNQLFAISLPFALLEGEHASKVLQIVQEKLVTPVGLKSLSADDSHYVGIYGGDPLHRDGSYHQGTVWSWLLGPYIESLVRVYKDRNIARKAVEAFSYHLNEGGIGTVSEILDGDGNHHPRGCIAQAWGVAEILRVMQEYGLCESGISKQEQIREITAT